jgi:antirestriction protein ArdC
MTATATTTKTDELLRQLTEGVEKLTSSDEWLRYLDVQRRFHRYSFGNCLLIALQSPDATRVAGFHRWLELGRHVRKGEKGIAILAPIVHRLKIEDEATGEEQTIVSAPRAFRVVYVFDVSQTDGDDLPEIPCHRLEGEGAAYDELTRYAESLGFHVEVGELPHETNGLCNHSTHTITLRSALAPAQQTKTLAHEIAHALLHGDGFDGPRAQAELEAESAAYIICGSLGLDTAQYSWGYLASWGADTDNIRRSGHRIQQTAQAILAGIGVSAEGAP